jgi:hypothetical protein
MVICGASEPSGRIARRPLAVLTGVVMSVFRAANNDDPAADPYVDGPTERLYDPEPPPVPPPPRPARAKGATVAVVVALLALLASGGACVVGWRALGAAGRTHVVAAPAPFVARLPVDPPKALDPSASYDVGYDGEAMRIQVGCGAAMLVDLDEPRADAGEQAGDLRYDRGCGQAVPTVGLAAGARAGSQVSDPDIDAPGCDDAIRTGPLGTGASVPVKKGAVLCVLTAAAPPRMARVEVTGLTAAGTATLTATSWVVPAR